MQDWLLGFARLQDRSLVQSFFSLSQNIHDFLIKRIQIKRIYKTGRSKYLLFAEPKNMKKIICQKKKALFTLSSMSSFLIDYMLFSIFVIVLPDTAVYLLISNIMARILSAACNYTINCMLVFREKPSLKSAVQYFVLAVCILSLNNLNLEFLAQGVGLSAYIAKLLTEFILFIISFLIQNLLIFKKGLTHREGKRL